MKRLVALLSVFMLVFVTGCGKSDVTDQIANVAQSVDPHVLGVKNGHPQAYPNISYDEAFGEFFGSPTWKYFVGTKEGPDEDGDGKPDYVEENVDIVEFTGYCMYMDVEVKALLQFTLNDDETFDATFLSFNEVPQNYFTLNALLSKAFESYEENHGSNSEASVEELQNVESVSEPSSVNTELMDSTESFESSNEEREEYKKFEDWCGFYEGGWVNTVLDFELYDTPNAKGECGYITENFKGNEEKGGLRRGRA